VHVLRIQEKQEAVMRGEFKEQGSVHVLQERQARRSCVDGKHNSTSNGPAPLTNHQQVQQRTQQQFNSPLSSQHNSTFNSPLRAELMGSCAERGGARQKRARELC
jgi:nitrous oxide reductase